MPSAGPDAASSFQTERSSIRPANGDRPARGKKLLVFVIAYHAETTLRCVLERIPTSLFDEFDAEILVVDDASADRTFEIACDYRDAHPHIPLTVLRNEYNQGYGGNQKVGYAYAIAHGFDIVAMVHGDGQYAPEELPKLVAPLREDQADAVFGSRMMTRLGALQGGMPLYKYLGNRILTAAQNALLGSDLSEFHSGYRLYSVQMLKSIPFHLNSDDFHFDTEIIIQLLNAKKRINELPIPTYYGDEICRVDGMKYARDVMMATVQNALHRAGLMYQRRFDTSSVDDTYDLKLGYASSHTYAIDAIPEGTKVTQVGGHHSGLASELEKKNCRVSLFEQHAPEHSAPQAWDVRDVGEPFHPNLEGDYVLMLDVIQRQRSPEEFFDALRMQFDFKARTLILTTPNIAFFVPRLMLMLGQFNYGNRGILDSRHARLFTFRSMEQLLRDEGFRIKEVRGIPAPFPKALGPGWLGRVALKTNLALIRLSKTLFSYQIYIRAESTPDINFVLEMARRSNTKPVAAAAPVGPGSAG